MWHRRLVDWIRLPEALLLPQPGMTDPGPPGWWAGVSGLVRIGNSGPDLRVGPTGAGQGAVDVSGGETLIHEGDNLAGLANKGEQIYEIKLHRITLLAL